MRAYCVLLVVAIALFTGTDASEQSANVKIASPNAPGLDRASIVPRTTFPQAGSFGRVSRRVRSTRREGSRESSTKHSGRQRS
jgi:hypothetical protein